MMNMETFDSKLIEGVIVRYLGGSQAALFDSPDLPRFGIVSVDVLGDIAVARVTPRNTDFAWLNSNIALVKQYGNWRIITGRVH